MARRAEKLHPVTQYAADVGAGRIPANKWVRLACARHLADLKGGKKRGLWFDGAAAAHIIAFFAEFLIFYEGEWDGQPFILQPWEVFIVGCLFGWKTSEGVRRFRTAYIEIGKGNGKSPVAAGIGLYGLAFDDEPGGEIYSAATKREQAAILFRDAKAFAEGSEALREILTVGQHNIAYEATNSFFRPVSSEERGLDGPRPHIALIDEIHEHPSAIVVDKLRSGTKGRRQALIVEITNAGYDRHSICFQHHEYSEKILEGLIENDSWFAYMTGLDVCKQCTAEGKTIPQEGCTTCDDWRDEKVWMKANPNLGVSIKPKYLREQVAEAIEMPAKQNIVKRLNFCIWTESITKWLPADRWAACGTPVDPEALRGRNCYGGLDLSTNIDLTAWVMVFPPLNEDLLVCVNCQREMERANVSRWSHGQETAASGAAAKNALILEICPECERKFIETHSTPMTREEAFRIRTKRKEPYSVLCRFFLPADNMADRVRKDKVPYDVWARQGFITLTPGNYIDYRWILDQIRQDQEAYHIAELAFDRFGSQKITTDLQEFGFQIEGDKTLVQFGQGYLSMNAPTKEVEKMVLAGELAHGNNPVLSWMVSNVAIQTDPAGNHKPDKEKSTERIDGAVAMIMAVGRAMLKGGVKPSVYEDRGVIAL